MERDLSGSLNVKNRQDISSFLIVTAENRMKGQFTLKAVEEENLPSSVDVKVTTDLPSSLSIPPGNRMQGRTTVTDFPRAESVFTPVKDALVRESVPRLNYGQEQTFEVGYDGEERRSYLAFFTEGLPENQVIDKAELRLYTSGAGTMTLPISLYEALDNWDELGITWTNQPGAGNLIQSSYTIHAAEGYISFDITAYLQDAYAKGQVLQNWALFSSALDDSAVFFSRESAQPPELVVVTYDPVIVNIGQADAWSRIHARPYVDLPSLLDVSKHKGDADLPASLTVHPYSDLLGGAVVQRSEIKDLSGSFIVFIGTAIDVPGKVVVKIHADMPGAAVVRKSASTDLYGRLSIGYGGESDLPGQVFVWAHTDLQSMLQVLYKKDVDLLSRIQVRQFGTSDLLGLAGVYPYTDLQSVLLISSEKEAILPSIVRVRQFGTSDLTGRLQAKWSADLPASVLVRGYTDLSSMVHVPYRTDLTASLIVYEHANVGGQVRVPFYQDLFSSLEVVGAATFPGVVRVISGNLSGILRVPGYETRDLSASIVSRVRFVSDLPAYVTVGEYGTSFYVFIM